MQRLQPGRLLVLLVCALACAGCVSVDYVGKSFPPTSNVDVYLAAADVGRPYQVIGNASAQVEAIPFTNPSQQLQEKLLAEARSRGADGIILGSVDSREVTSTQQTFGQADSKKKGSKKKTQYTETTTTSTSEIKSLHATLIKYTAP
ncbi:MAG: hypothetical protein AB1689_01230 [Thermodesulfobacteriota bacterium]